MRWVEMELGLGKDREGGLGGGDDAAGREGKVGERAGRICAGGSLQDQMHEMTIGKIPQP